jgi:hypothetical protein
MTDENIEQESAMQRLLNNEDMESLGMTIAGVLEFLTMRALHDGAFYIMTDDEKAITVFAAEEDATALKAALPEHFKTWEEELSEPEVLTNVDPGDEQVGETE